MRLYDEVIAETLSLLGNKEAISLPLGREWPDEGKAMMILRPDMAYELGGSGLPALGNTLVTTNENLVPHDGITLIGKDLPEIKEDSPYARLAIVRVREDEVGSGDRLYNTIRAIASFRYRIFPSGFMLRASSSLERESVRVSAEKLRKGLNFASVGSVMLKALHKYRGVEEVRIIFITDPGVDYQALQRELKKTREITAAIDHMLKDVDMDCGSCGLQEICDEVEDLRKMHFGISENAHK